MTGLARVFQRRWVWVTGGMILLTFLFLQITHMTWYIYPHRIQMLMQMCILAGIAVYVLRCAQGKASDHSLYILILYIGMVMRVGYALYTPTDLRPHDLYGVDINSAGHAGYILNLFVNFSLPPNNAAQFSQPPLFYAVSAGFMKIYQLLWGIDDVTLLIEASRLTSCFAACGSLAVVYQIGRELKLNRSGMIVLVGITAFLPVHYLTGGCANPDALSVFFLFAIVWFTIRWFHTQTLQNTVLLALWFGLGLMTKFTVAVPALPTGLIMLYVLWRQKDSIQRRHVIKLLLIFLLIAIPIGLWHAVRNAILYGQKLGGVFALSKETYVYIGHLSMSYRYGWLSIHHFYSPLYVTDIITPNLWIILFKTAVFGEYVYDIDKFAPMLLLVSNYALVLLSLASMSVKTWRAVRNKQIPWIFLALTWLTAFMAYFLFTIRYPFWCSMDYRYAIITSLTGALFLASGMPQGKGGRLASVYRVMVWCALCAFAVGSIAMYTSIQ
jgi:4-amino-4-deoxy-L-arabinose transferase-like glycosyltransferase